MTTPCLGLPNGPQCDAFALPGRPRCAVHDAIMNARKAARHKTKRGAPKDRGLGADWQRARRYLAKTATRCAECDMRLPIRNGKPVFDMDHIIARADWFKRYGTYDGVNDPGNLQALCRECHAAKTAAENRRRNRGVAFG